PQNDVTLKMPAFEWVHVQLHQQKGMISLSPPTICNSAFGTVLTRKWQPPVPLLTFTAWQLAAGGLLLVPVALVFDPPIPMPTGTNVLGLAWLGLIGAGLTYFLWFRGISRLEPTVVSLLGFLSPGTAVLLGWLFLDQTLSALQIIGVLLVIGSIWLGQRSNRTPRARIACRKSP
ncbi:DMT family transporter, partial [Klebsiella quasipneumoniae subsp. similipneumoniae]|uniref:DMT family transporter n=1 Tax=Klebsiella quasipneumoniae TaxID=1463165 RepID=UPI00403AD207